mmetsp:Transcript_25481/g.37028  ORF Transcript_25481/g.37028 Transcript_25481/m.37028 type:complete len:254 (-) Transcript_25481:262-1023(-)
MSSTSSCARPSIIGRPPLLTRVLRRLREKAHIMLCPIGKLILLSPGKVDIASAISRDSTTRRLLFKDRTGHGELRFEVSVISISCSFSLLSRSSSPSCEYVPLSLLDFLRRRSDIADDKDVIDGIETPMGISPLMSTNTFFQPRESSEADMVASSSECKFLLESLDLFFLLPPSSLLSDSEIAVALSKSSNEAVGNVSHVAMIKSLKVFPAFRLLPLINLRTMLSWLSSFSNMFAVPLLFISSFLTSSSTESS